VPDICARIITARFATMRELQEFYGSKDLYNLAEIMNVNAYNQNALRER